MTLGHPANVIFMAVIDQWTKDSHEREMSQNCFLSQRHQNETHVLEIDEKFFTQFLLLHIQRWLGKTKKKKEWE